MVEEIIEQSKKYKQHPAFTHYVEGFKPYYEDVFKLLPESKTSLDVGCAYGILAMMLAKRGDTTFASDMTSKYTSLPMLKDNGIEFIKNNIEKKSLPIKVDLITFTETIEHLNSNPLKSIKRLYDALNDNGHIFCATVAKEKHGETVSMNHGEKGLWNDLKSWKDIPEYKGVWKDEHTYHYNQYDLVTLFSEAGFEIEDIGMLNDFSHYIIGKKCK